MRVISWNSAMGAMGSITCLLLHYGMLSDWGGWYHKDSKPGAANSNQNLTISWKGFFLVFFVLLARCTRWQRCNVVTYVVILVLYSLCNLVTLLLPALSLLFQTGPVRHDDTIKVWITEIRSETLHKTCKACNYNVLNGTALYSQKTHMSLPMWMKYVLVTVRPSLITVMS